jgi:hypothetical protein
MVIKKMIGPRLCVQCYHENPDGDVTLFTEPIFLIKMPCRSVQLCHKHAKYVAEQLTQLTKEDQYE